MSPTRQIVVGVALLGVVVVVGTLGYTLIEGVALFDAFYMVVITVSTVGIGEVFPLSTAGQIWTMAIIVVRMPPAFKAR